MFDKALLNARNETELNALALVVILATSSTDGKRYEDWESGEVRYLTALMAHEKINPNPTFENIRKLLFLDMDAAEPALKAAWNGDAANFRKGVLGALSMRVIELCEYQDRFVR